MAGVTSITGSSLVHQTRYDRFDKISKLTEGVALKLGFDLRTREEYRDAISQVIDQTLFQQRLQFSPETKGLLHKGDERILPLVIFAIVNSYLREDKKDDEFPKFFEKILHGRVEKELEGLRKEFKENDEQSSFAHQLVFDYKKFYKTTALGPSSSIRDILNLFRSIQPEEAAET